MTKTTLHILFAIVALIASIQIAQVAVLDLTIHDQAIPTITSIDY